MSAKFTTRIPSNCYPSDEKTPNSLTLDILVCGGCWDERGLFRLIGITINGGSRVSVLFCNLNGICGGFGYVRCVCVVFLVLVMRCLYADKVPVSMRQPKVRQTTVYGYLVVSLVWVECVCVGVDVRERSNVRDTFIMCPPT